jgi:hypothetical protein
MLRLLYRPRPFQRAQICGDRLLGTGDMIEASDCLKKTNIFPKLKPVKYIEELIKNSIVERENAFFKSSPVDEYHLLQMNSEKVFFGCVLRIVLEF